MNLGSSLRASPLLKQIFLVERYTISPRLKGAACHLQLASWVCFTWAERMLSCAEIIASFFCRAKFRTDGNSANEFEFQIMDLGICLEFRKNGAKPVLSNHAELMENLIAGNFSTQSF